MAKRKGNYVEPTGYQNGSPNQGDPNFLVNSGRVTMQNVPFPVMGIDNYGNQQMMMPGGEYRFPGNQVFEIPIRQLGGGDPEMMYRDKFNTPLTTAEYVQFNKWLKEENKRQGRDVMMDKGTYDIQGFWKSGAYKDIDEDGHGTDLFKKPNHPTFSDQSIYSIYGDPGIWEEETGAYHAPASHKQLYGKDYYDWMKSREPHRKEHFAGYMGPPVVVTPKKQAGGGFRGIDPDTKVNYDEGSFLLPGDPNYPSGIMEEQPFPDITPYESDDPAMRGYMDSLNLHNWGKAIASFDTGPDTYIPWKPAEGWGGRGDLYNTLTGNQFDPHPTIKPTYYASEREHVPIFEAPKVKPRRTTPDPQRSVADNLRAMGEDPSFANRKKLAQEAGITDYKGTSAQNVELNKWLHSGKPLQSPPPSHVLPKKDAVDPNKDKTKMVDQYVFDNATISQDEFMPIVSEMIQSGMGEEELLRTLKDKYNITTKQVEKGPEWLKGLETEGPTSIEGATRIDESSEVQEPGEGTQWYWSYDNVYDPQTGGMTTVKKKVYTDDVSAPQYQTGGPATRADSTAVMQSSQDLLDYYKGTGAYKQKESSSYDPKSLFDMMAANAAQAQEGFTAKVPAEIAGKYPGDPKNRMGLNTQNAWMVNTADRPGMYYKELDPNRFQQRELAYNIMDTRAPMGVYDRRIMPQYLTKFENIVEKDPMLGDIVTIPMYDPLAVTPWDMLSDEKKRERVEKFGVSGTEYQNKPVPEGWKVPEGTASTKPRRTTPDPDRSVVDNLRSMGEDASFANRKKLAKQAGIENYKGDPSQNVALNKWLQEGRPTAKTDKTLVTKEDTPTIKDTPLKKKEEIPTKVSVETIPQQPIQSSADFLDLLNLDTSGQRISQTPEGQLYYETVPGTEIRPVGGVEKLPKRYGGIPNNNNMAYMNLQRLMQPGGTVQKRNFEGTELTTNIDPIAFDPRRHHAQAQNMEMGDVVYEPRLTGKSFLDINEGTGETDEFGNPIWAGKRRFRDVVYDMFHSEPRITPKYKQGGIMPCYECGGMHKYPLGGQNFTPHTMYDTQGNPYPANTYEDHMRMQQMGYGHQQMAEGGNWIQKATASIKARGTEGRCSGSNFGGPDCPKGSRQYNLAKTFKKMAASRKKKTGGTAPQNMNTDGLLEDRKNVMTKYFQGGVQQSIQEDELALLADAYDASFQIGGMANPYTSAYESAYNDIQSQRRGTGMNLINQFGMLNWDPVTKRKIKGPQGTMRLEDQAGWTDFYEDGGQLKKYQVGPPRQPYTWKDYQRDQQAKLPGWESSEWMPRESYGYHDPQGFVPSGNEAWWPRGGNRGTRFPVQGPVYDRRGRLVSMGRPSGDTRFGSRWYNADGTPYQPGKPTERSAAEGDAATDEEMTGEELSDWIRTRDRGAEDTKKTGTKKTSSTSAGTSQGSYDPSVTDPNKATYDPGTTPAADKTTEPRTGNYSGVGDQGYYNPFRGQGYQPQQGYYPQQQMVVYPGVGGFGRRGQGFGAIGYNPANTYIQSVDERARLFDPGLRRRTTTFGHGPFQGQPGQYPTGWIPAPQDANVATQDPGTPVAKTDAQIGQDRDAYIEREMEKMSPQLYSRKVHGDITPEQEAEYQRLHTELTQEFDADQARKQAEIDRKASGRVSRMQGEITPPVETDLKTKFQNWRQERQAEKERKGRGRGNRGGGRGFFGGNQGGSDVPAYKSAVHPGYDPTKGTMADQGNPSRDEEREQRRLNKTRKRIERQTGAPVFRQDGGNVDLTKMTWDDRQALEDLRFNQRAVDVNRNYAQMMRNKDARQEFSDAYDDYLNQWESMTPDQQRMYNYIRDNAMTKTGEMQRQIQQAQNSPNYYFQVGGQGDYIHKLDTGPIQKIDNAPYMGGMPQMPQEDMGQSKFIEKNVRQYDPKSVVNFALEGVMPFMTSMFLADEAAEYQRKLEESTGADFQNQAIGMSAPQNEGYWGTNTGMVKGSNATVPVQFQGQAPSGYGSFTKYGGTPAQEMYLSDDEIQQVLAMGGSVEYL